MPNLRRGYVGNSGLKFSGRRHVFNNIKELDDFTKEVVREAFKDACENISTSMAIAGYGQGFSFGGLANPDVYTVEQKYGGYRHATFQIEYHNDLLEPPVGSSGPDERWQHTSPVGPEWDPENLLEIITEGKGGAIFGGGGRTSTPNPFLDDIISEENVAREVRYALLDWGVPIV